MPNAKNILGKIFGRLTVLERVQNDRHGKTQWRCECICGAITEPRGADLRKGSAQSCGCLKLERTSETHRTHGCSSLPEYDIWRAMKRRCMDPDDENYKHYGGRGIRVCGRWLESVENFISDMGLRPQVDLSIDRINNDGNYEPSNCKWATRAEQARNKRAA